MATQLHKVLEHLHRVLAPRDDSLTDGQLLARFITARDQASFGALVRRHGPMVWRVCLRVLGHVQDAEDTFQATFLVLACKASAVVKQESVGSFLYGVAYRTALDARTVRARRQRRERQVEAMPHPETAPTETPDWRPWLDQELSRLPEKYRIPVILCDLEGCSRKEAARHLKVPEGTLSSRLATARRLLAKRLARYGLSLSGGALAVALSEGVSAAVPSPLVSTTIRMAVLSATGQAAISASVAVLMKGALKTMLLTKLKWTMGVVLVLTALGASGLVYQASGQSPAADRKPLSELEALRRENELLKLNLEIVLEKVRNQDTELRALRGKVENVQAAQTWAVVPENQLRLHLAPQPPFAIKVKPDSVKQQVVPQTNPIREVETALKALQEAREPEAKRRAAEALDKAFKRLREQLAKQVLSKDDVELRWHFDNVHKPHDASPPR
jgi:RNA polymerase sigma factor (sigma-70 family)